MLQFNINGFGEIYKSLVTATATIIVGVLGFSTAIITIIINYRYNKQNLAFLLEKDRREHEARLKRDELEFSRDKRERQKSYNRVLGNFLKVYHSYLKHKLLFDDDGVKNFPDEALTVMIEKVDTFNIEIALFRKCVNDEAEIVPELTVYLHEILDILSRFELMNSQLPNDPSNPDIVKSRLILQRAHNFAVKELLDEYFIDLIDELSKKADVSEEFLILMKEFNSTDFSLKNTELQEKIMNRLCLSLSKQTGQDITPENIFGFQQ